MLRIVPHTVPRVGRSYEHFPDGFELHLLPGTAKAKAMMAKAKMFVPARPEADLTEDGSLVEQGGVTPKP